MNTIKILKRQDRYLSIWYNTGTVESSGIHTRLSRSSQIGLSPLAQRLKGIDLSSLFWPRRSSQILLGAKQMPRNPVAWHGKAVEVFPPEDSAHVAQEGTYSHAATWCHHTEMAANPQRRH